MRAAALITLVFAAAAASVVSGLTMEGPDRLPSAAPIAVTAATQ